MPIHGITATYQPFSFQERLAPLQMMKEEYDKINEGLAVLGESANQYYQYLDPETRQVVDSYNATLKQASDDIAANGMKAVSRNTLNELRRQYSTSVLPIQQAAQTVGTMQAQIREMAMKDPTLIIQSVPSVSDVMKNPSATPSLVSGAQLQKEGINAALQLQGVDYDTLSRFINGDTSAIPDIDKVAQQIANTYGVSTDQAFGYINSGIMSGLGQRAASMYEAQQKQRMEEESYIRKLNAQYAKEIGIAGIKHNYTMQEIQERNKGKISGSSSSGTSSGRGGTSYINQIGGVVYAKGDQERMFNTVKDAESAMSSTKATYKGFMDLNKENKVRVLRALGASVTQDSSEDAIDSAIIQYENELYNYAYMEYRDKENKSSSKDEFFMIPNKVRRDTYTDNEFDDYVLSQE